MSGVVQCFWLEPSDFVRVRLRRYRYSDINACVAQANKMRCCDAEVVIHDHVLRSAWVEELDGCTERCRKELVSDDSPQWPDRCDACGIPFEEDSNKQVWADRLYTGTHNGVPCTIRGALPGAMWNAAWWPDKGPDGICLMVKLPDGTDWMVDDGRWRRTGDPRKPDTLTIRESIRSPRYHGFVTNGKLEPCGDSQT